MGSQIAMAEVTSESGANPNENLSAARALGLMWNVPEETTCLHPLPAPTTPSTSFSLQPRVPPMPPPITPPMPSIPSIPPMTAPSASFDNSGSCGADQLLAIAMPGLLAGLSNLQIEEHLRAAASQIDVYDD